MPSLKDGVSDGIRTHDDRDHNPGLYQLSYAHHLLRYLTGTSSTTGGRGDFRNNKPLSRLARPAGIEPATPSLEGWCSIRLSYGRVVS